MPKPMKLPMILLATAAIVMPLRAATPRDIEATADRLVEAAMREKHIPGLVLAIVKDGKVVVKKGYGVKTTGSREVPDANTVFSIGSLSKSLTAFGVMRLVDEGKVDLDAPASTYIANLPTAWRKITVRQFMTMTSGIPQLKAKEPTFDAELRQAGQMPMAFPPGTKQDYNNFNFAVAGKIIESVSGEPYLTYMQRRVFEPLGMRDTGRSGRVKTSDRATGYTPRGKAIEPQGSDYGVPSGFLETSINDLLKFDDALRTHALMKPRTYQEMLTPTIVPGRHTWSFTPGWQWRKAGNVTVIAKNGAVDGFSSQYHFVPERGDAVIMIWNTKGKGLDLWAVVADILDQCLGIPKPGR